MSKTVCIDTRNHEQATALQAGLILFQNSVLKLPNVSGTLTTFLKHSKERMMRLSERGEMTRQKIVEVIRTREAELGLNSPSGGPASDRRIRGALRTMLSRGAPEESALSQLTGLDEHGWVTWIQLQELLAHALSGNGGFDAIEAACEDLGIGGID